MQFALNNAMTMTPSKTSLRNVMHGRAPYTVLTLVHDLYQPNSANPTPHCVFPATPCNVHVTTQTLEPFPVIINPFPPPL